MVICGCIAAGPDHGPTRVVIDASPWAPRASPGTLQQIIVLETTRDALWLMVMYLLAAAALVALDTIVAVPAGDTIDAVPTSAALSAEPGLVSDCSPSRYDLSLVSCWETEPA